MTVKKHYTVEEIARYLIDSPFVMWEDGYYYAHWDEESGLVYEYTPDTVDGRARAAYADEISREEFDAKESLADPDFMEVCEALAYDLNQQLAELDN